MKEPAWAWGCMRACTQLCSGRATKRRQRSAICAPLAPILSACPPSPRRLQSATHGVSVCAEEFAIVTAIIEGERGFDAISVVKVTDALTPPCRAYRQLIWEFCGDVPVILSNLKGKTETIQMKALFPKPFDSSHL